MPAFASLKEEHREIGDHIAELSVDRGEFPVFMIEHGRSAEQLSNLRNLLRRQLELDPGLSSPQWNWCYLPLLAATAEVGYRYRGTGTDFWPVVEQDLHVNAGNGFRSGLVRLFETAHREHAIARPGESPWELHFPLIAWPIANALVPLELQPQLARALQQSLRAGFSGKDPDALYRYLVQVAAGQAGRRFENWLHQADTATEVTRRLLYPESEGWLSGEILTRIDHDLRKDAAASIAIREARRITERRAKAVTDIPPSRFVLSLMEQTPTTVLIRGPVLSTEVREEVTMLLRCAGDKIRALGSDRAVDLRSFLFGGSMAIGVPTSLPHSPLRREGSRPQEDDASERLLSALQPKVASYFLVGAGGVEASAVFPGERLPTGSQVIKWGASVDDETPEFHWLSSNDKGDAELLRNAGFHVSTTRTGFRVLGLPLPGEIAKFAAGFSVMASTEVQDAPLRLDAEFAPSKFDRFGERTWSVFEPEPGEHSIEDIGGDAGTIEFEVVEAPETERAEISFDPLSPTIADLESGNLSVRITAPVALENVRVRMRLSASGRPPVDAHGVLERVPCLIRGSSGILHEIRSHLISEQVGLAAARLRVEVDGFRARLVDLPPPINRRLFDPVTELWSTEDGSSTPVGSLCATADSPLPRGQWKGMSDLRLVIPDASDHEALSSGHVLIGNRESIAPEQCRVPPVIREASGNSERPGIGDLARASVAWRLASCSNAVGDWKRNLIAEELDAALLQILCGDPWFEQEAKLDLSILTSHGALLNCAWRRWLTRGDQLPPITKRSDQTRLNTYLLERLRLELPDLDQAIAEWSDETAADLDMAVIDAYDDLRRYHEDHGLETFEEPDMSRLPHVWLSALKEASEITTLPMFRSQILPARRWDTLVGASYGDLTQDDLVDLLDSCHVDSFRRPGFRWMGRTQIRTLLQFWLSPAQMIADENWADALARAVSDPQTARAVRYVTLRWRLAARDLPETVMS